jgi:hypothetical protein
MVVKLHGKNARIYLNGYDISAGFNNFDGPGQADTVDASTFGGADKEYVVGLRSGSMRLQGIWDATPGATGIDDILGDVEAQDSPMPIVTVWPGGDVLGYPGKGAAEIETAISRTSPIGGVVGMSVDMMASGGFHRLRNLFPKGTMTAAGGTIEPDNGGTAVAATLIGVLQAFQVLSGTPVVTVEQSANGTSGWTAALTFSALQSAQTPQAQLASVTATIQPFKRTNITGGQAIVNVGYIQQQ